MVMMKMAAVSIIVVLLCSIFASADSQGDCDYIAATNGNFTIPLHWELTGSENLRWKYNNEIIFNRRPNKLLVGKASDVTKNGSLHLINVNKKAAGTYTPEVYHDGKSQGTLKGMQLCILDPVPKPQVKIQCLKSSVKFTCEVGKNINILNEFEWLKNDKVVNKAQTLEFKTAKEVETDIIYCKVSNPISNAISAPVKQNCIKPASGLPDKILGINTWILVGGGGGIVVVLIIVIIVCCICNKRRKRLQLKDEEELRLGWTNPDQQQHHQHQHNHPPDQHCHHQHQRQHQHQHQQQPAGNTGPRQPRSKQQRNLQRPRDPNQPNGQPLPSPRRAAQQSRPVVDDDEKPPPLPQPRKKATKTPRV